MLSVVQHSRDHTADSYEENNLFLSRSFTSKRHFVKQYRKLYNEKTKAKELYFQIITELETAISEGRIDHFKNCSILIDYISDAESKSTLKSFHDDKDYQLKNTNLVILACMHNRIDVLEYLLLTNSNIIHNLSTKVGKNSILPDDKDDKCHNAFYYIISSGTAEMLNTLINKWPSNYFVARLDKLEKLISEAYEELKLKNVLLSVEMEICVQHKLIDMRFNSVSTGEKIKGLKINFNNIRERIELVLENISLLNLNLEVGDKFVFTAKFIASNIHILKQQLKSTYDRLPWEEIEFCLVCFISSHTKQQEVNLFYQATLNKDKILNYLKSFADLLEEIKVNIKGININKFVLSSLNREKVVLDIIDSCPQFEELYKDYQEIRDIYSLEKIKSHIDMASSVDTNEREGQLVITRVLQVMGEHFKNTLESPKLSSFTSKLLLLSLPKNTREMIKDLRDSFSHADSLSKRIEIEENTDVNFFTGVQKDVLKIGIVIRDILYNYKTKFIRILLEKIINSESLEEIREVAEVLNNVKFDKTDIDFLKIKEPDKIEKLIDEACKKITDMNEYEKKRFNKMKDIINMEKSKLINIEKDYDEGLLSLKSLCYSVLNNKMENCKIEMTKFAANISLDNIAPKVDLHSFKEMYALSLEIFCSIRNRTHPDDFGENIKHLLFKISYAVQYEKVNVKWIEKLRENFPLKSKNKRRKMYKEPEDQTDIDNSKLTLKLSELKSILTKYSLDNVGITALHSYQSNKQLQAVVEMLLLDILSILSSLNCLPNNLLFLDAMSPSLIGISLRNHLAHNNALIDVVLFDASLEVLLNASILTSKNLLENKIMIGKSNGGNTSKLKDKYDQGLLTITNQERLFASLEKGNLEELKRSLKNGADLNARNVRLWTTLHFAAKGPSIEVLNFILDQNLNFKVKDINGQSPFHIAAEHGRKEMVEYLIEEVGLCVDDVDKNAKRPLHMAAQNGHKNIVEILLKNKANTFTKDNSGYSPLHYAVQKNFKDVVEILIKKEANIDSNKAEGGVTSLHIAAEMGYLELVIFLLENKADVNAKNAKGSTPLCYSAINDHLEVVNALILKGANVNTQTINDCTPLGMAVGLGNKNVVDILLKHGAYIEVPDKTHHYTPLHIAVKGGHEEIVKTLLENGANANANDFNGETPLHFAVP